MNSTRIGFLGAGNMAFALLSGLVSKGTFDKTRLLASEPRADRRAELSAALGIEVLASNAELCSAADVLVLSVKPQVVPAVLSECGGSIGAQHLLISIAAGVSIASLEARLGPGARVLRAMPNTPALAGASATALASGTVATPEDVALARSMFDAVGKTVVLAEHHLDAVTGLSGSGPAYVMLFVEALADGGVKAGLSRDVALLLATQTVYGAAKLLLETGEHPAQLRDMVTSPGGTTIAGLAVLEQRAVRGAVIEAVERATARASELGKANV
jgi:pyrroline-5-carboxylate reductase